MGISVTSEVLRWPNYARLSKLKRGGIVLIEYRVFADGTAPVPISRDGDHTWSKLEDGTIVVRSQSDLTSDDMTSAIMRLAAKYGEETTGGCTRSGDEEWIRTWGVRT